MSDPCTFDEALFSDAAIENPWPVYARMRNAGPVLWLPRLGNYALPRHRQVQQALRDHDTYISRRGVAADHFGCEFLQGNTVASDGCRHSKLRQAMAEPMLPAQLGHIADQIQTAADNLIDDLLKRGSFDAVNDFATCLPLTVIRDRVGLPEFGQDKMLHWAAAAFDVLGIQNSRGRQALPVIADMRHFIEREATRDNLKPGSWTRRILALADAGLLPAELAPYAIRDYINPSLDTTIAASAELIFQLARNPQQWALLKRKPELINNAVNEAVRLASPIRLFCRHTSRDTQICGTPIAAGSRVMMLFASANRDERHFSHPDQFDINRTVRDHVGFGSGVHMCVGMHLAQLELEALLTAMIPRVAGISVGRAVRKLNNTICAYARLDCTFQPESRYFSVPPRPGPNAAAPLEARVSARRKIATDIICLELEPTAGTDFPPAEPGAHIDVWIDDTRLRQYSLTGQPQSGRYCIAVQQAADSRGGSRWIHQQLTCGSLVRIGAPRNLFHLPDWPATTLLVAGGIGVTPLLAMAWQLHRSRRDFELHISARSYARLPFAAEHRQWPFHDRLTVYLDDSSSASSTLNTTQLLAGRVDDIQLLVCGPKGFMAQVCSAAKAAGLADSNLHVEHFGAEIDPTGEAFTIEARRSGKTLQVYPDQTAVEVLRAAGIAVQTSCEQGVCGSCLTTVLDGIPAHRDLVQSAAEKAGNARIALCCSRSLSKTLVLDI